MRRAEFIRYGVRQGFTLIELSIVLVIIALIAGGVLVGQEMVEASRIRSQLTQIEQFTTAAKTFQLKYNCLPGDCARAESYGLGSSSNPGRNGNGDGRISGTNGSLSLLSLAGDGSEALNFWYHLGQAGLISEQLAGFTGQADLRTEAIMADTMPKAKASKLLNGYIIPSYISQCVWPANTCYRNGGNTFILGGLISVNYLNNPLTGSAAKSIDSKIDDGLPFSGTVVCAGFTSGTASRQIIADVPEGAPNCQGGYVASPGFRHRCQANPTSNEYLARSYISGGEEYLPACSLVFLNRF